jgi:hypothetical protein
MNSIQIPRITDITGRKSAQDSAADKEWQKAADEYQLIKQRNQLLKKANRELHALQKKNRKANGHKQGGKPYYNGNQQYKERLLATRSF